MSVRVGINGFGRIGRNVFRAAKAAGADIDIVAVNDLTDPKTLAHLFKYDSILGPLPGRGRGRRRRDRRSTATRSRSSPSAIRPPCPGATSAPRSSSSPPASSPNRDDAAKHLGAGAKKVIISAPAKGEDITVVLGVNFDDYDKDAHHIISNASCTTNCLAPFAKVAQRHGRHQARPDDDDPRLHRRPEPAGRARTRTCAAPAPPRSTWSRPRPAPPRRSASCCRS